MPSTPVLVSLDEYLTTSYRPDRDYIDGELKERNLGEKPHSKIQAFLVGYFLAHKDEWRVDPLPEQRVQVGPSSYRIPDLSLISLDAPDELILRTPPLLCVEILSREDRMNDILDRVADYRRMGVSATWIINPWRREAHSVSANGALQPESSYLRVPQTSIHVSVPDIFRQLPETLA
jgi:Uma2 family endonuclease